MQPSLQPPGPADSFSVSLSADHPGLLDLDYRRRRDAIADLARGHRPGEPCPRVSYIAEEEATWKEIWRHLLPEIRANACAEALAPLERWRPWDRPIPQLDELADAGGPLEHCPIRFEPVEGLLTPVDFFASLADGVFRSTQYLRHSSRPLYTPEPDLVHELIGHAGTFAANGVAELSLEFGQAMGRAAAKGCRRTMAAVERLYWFTVEFGVVLEGGVPKAFGAGLLSSAGEISSFKERTLRRLDLTEITETPYVTDRAQPLLFVADSFESLIEQARTGLRVHCQ